MISRGAIPPPRRQVGAGGATPNYQTINPPRNNAPRKATERGGTLIFSQPEFESAIFWRIPLKSPNFSAPGAPPPTPNRGRRELQNYCRKKTHRGTPRNATERGGALKFSQPALEPAMFWRIPLKFPSIFAPGAPSPTPNWGGRLDIRNYRRQKTPRHPTERCGARRNAKIKPSSLGIRHILADLPQISQYFRPRTPPSPTPNWGVREIRNYRRQQTHRGTPRNATERGGNLKFSQTSLESAIFWRVPLKFPNIFRPGHPSQCPIAGGWDIRNYRR